LRAKQEGVNGSKMKDIVEVGDQEKVQGYFDRNVDEFDEFYREKKSGLRRWVDRNLRASMTRRYELTFELCSPLKDKTVLDLGCAGGRYSISAAKQGASRVLGVDFADQMLELAGQLAKRAGVEQACEFRQADVTQLELDETFDYTFANGFFDYIEEPLPVIQKALSWTRGALVASFPVKWNVWTPQRAIRYKLKGCPLFFYSVGDLEKLDRELPDYSMEIHSLGRDFLVQWKPKS
jgi:2-polyprenyl-3-methyl-5-hydroxy-6-metoxy-1,4-benzoquinol methylase